MSLAEKVRRLQRHRAFEAEVVKNLSRVETLKQMAEVLLDDSSLALVFAPLALRPASTSPSVASEQSRGRSAPPLAGDEVTLGRVLATDSPLCADWERALGDLDEVKAHVQKRVNEAIERWNRYEYSINFAHLLWKLALTATEIASINLMCTSKR